MQRSYAVFRSLNVRSRVSVILTLAAALGCGNDPVTPRGPALAQSLLVYAVGDSAALRNREMKQLRAVRPTGADDRPYLNAGSVGHFRDIVASPTGSHVAIARWPSPGIAIVDALGQMQTIDFDSTSTETASEIGWSPDGTRLAYHRWNGFTGGRGLDIVTLGAGVVDVRAQLAGGLACDGSADVERLRLELWRWLAPDRVEFVWDRCAEPDRTFHISTAGEELEEIIPATRSMAWLSPSGSRTLYFDGTSPMIALAEGSGAQSLSPSGTAYRWGFFRRMVSPWSPDGTHVMLYRADATCDEQPFVLSIDGSREGPLTSDEGCWEFHSWSPDGEWIAAARVDAGAGGVIHLFSRDGREHVELVVGTESQFVVDVAWIQAP